MGRKKDNFWESALMNNKTFLQYYNRLVELSLNVFEWKNLPDSIDPRFLELTLFGDGMSVFFKDDVMGYLALQVMISGELDVYRIPIKRNAYAVNGYHNSLTNNNSVIIFNNYTHTNSQLDIEMYAQRLYEAERAIDVNVKQQKTPKIIKCSESQRLVMENLMKQYNGNEPFIFGDKDLDTTEIKPFDISSPFVADKLQILKRQIWNEALTYIGIENSNTEKKERLVTDEIQSNLGGVEAQRFTRLNARKDACKKINTMFPELKIDVEFRQDIIGKKQETKERGSEEGE
jgi:hypothetical protein